MGAIQKHGRKMPRRKVLGGLCVTGIAVPVASTAQIPDEASLIPPRENDVLVHSFGDDSGKVIRIDELASGQ